MFVAMKQVDKQFCYSEVTGQRMMGNNSTQTDSTTINVIPDTSTYVIKDTNTNVIQNTNIHVI